MVPGLHEPGRMVSAILHVEDDLALRGLVELAFQGFGFRGTVETAGSVAETVEYLADAQKLDLVISDMSLPDGSGLDVVRHVRSSNRWRLTPVLILSGDVNPKNVGRAYSLGANAYLDKSPPGRTLIDVIKSLYEHWGKDVSLPVAPAPQHRHDHVLVAIGLRKRFAQLYHRLADMLGDQRSEAAFWLSRALAESNLINLLRFLQHELGDCELPAAFAEGIELMQAQTAQALTVVEQIFDRGRVSRIEAYRGVVTLLGTMNVELLARTISHLFPAAPVAMEALREFLLGSLNDVAAWVQLNTDDPTLFEQAEQLRTRMASVCAD